MAWGSHSEKEMIIGKVILEISRKNDVHNNYETDYRLCHAAGTGNDTQSSHIIGTEVTLLGQS